MADIVDHCWLLDLDRTLSSVDIVMEAVEHLCELMSLDYEKISEQKTSAESNGHSFSAVTTIRSLWPERVDEFFDKFKKIDHLNSIYPDAKQFIVKLKEENLPFIVITYGDPVWQEAKLHLLGLWAEPFIICDMPEKSVLLRQYQNNGVFEMHTSSGIICASKITLVDDKPVAFINMPRNSAGICINRANKDLDLDEGIREISSFADLMNDI